MSATRTIRQYAQTQLRYHLLTPFLAPSRLRKFISRVVEFDFHECGTGRRLPATSILDVFPEIRDTTCTFSREGAWGDETLYLCAALQVLKPETALEIGTFRGATTLQIALNLPPQARLFTVDVDPADQGPARKYLSTSDRKLVDKKHEQIGDCYRKHPAADRITQIIGDSANIDYRQYFQHLDFAFIDGGHSYQQVRADTEAILPFLRPGGAVFWHDYQPGCEGVTSYLHELAREYPLKNIRRTQLVALRT